jgi:hypothetical protein
MTKKDVLDCVLENSEILQEFAKKLLKKHAVQIQFITFFYWNY